MCLIRVKMVCDNFVITEPTYSYHFRYFSWMLTEYFRVFERSWDGAMWLLQLIQFNWNILSDGKMFYTLNTTEVKFVVLTTENTRYTRLLFGPFKVYALCSHSRHSLQVHSFPCCAFLFILISLLLRTHTEEKPATGNGIAEQAHILLSNFSFW